MSGLDLIGTYSSDSENEEDLSKFSDNGNSNKFKESLPLPHSISNWKGVVHHEEVFDDPNEHDGRTRSFKHERGNWATLVYTKYEPEDFIRSWMESACNELPVRGKYLFDEFHLSLTRTLVLKFHWIDSFVESVKNLCRETDRFSIELGDVKVYCNDEKTRTFLAIECSTVDDSLERITEALNKILAEYRLPAFYEEASFHVSFMWSNGNVESALQPFIPFLSAQLARILLENPGHRVSIDQLYCKIGNRMYSFPLK